MLRTPIALALAMTAAAVVAAGATAAEKPIVVLSRPADCSQTAETMAACTELAAAVAHPTIQRRLAKVVLETNTTPEGEGPFVVAVHDPGGRVAIRWHVLPGWLMLVDILALVETAAPHLIEAHRATAAGDSFKAGREWSLALLALGDKQRGRALLESMSVSDSAENRELAAIWLERLDALESGEAPREETLIRHAREGATDRVRFEAWMAAGDVRLEEGRVDDAVEAYDEAVKLSAEGSDARHNARTARERAPEMWSPLIGIESSGSVIAGRRSVRPRVIEENVATVEYRLDGRLVATAGRAPFSGSVDFGRIPKRRVLEVAARTAAGAVLSRFSIVVNERSEAFDVELIEPAGNQLSGPVDIAVAARVPRGRTTEHLTIEWNGAAVARFTAPPYRTRFDVPREQGVLRAVLRLDDGSETEDVRLINSEAATLETGAHLVEVPVYFGEASPVAHDVVVREAGKPRTVERIIRPADAPLLIGILIDSSSSMTEHMLDVQEAAISFVEEHIEPRDRTMIVGFDSSVRMLVRPTSDRAMVERSILALRPRGGTALYDAMITALLQLRSSGWRKALVVFSDGLDASSRFSSRDAAEVARRAGVPIYVLALTPDVGAEPARFGRSAVMVPTAAETIGRAKRELMAISRRTGGKAFEMRSLDALPGLWSEIAADLRRQSLLIYRTDTSGAEWRPLELSLTTRGRVRAPTGVYVTTTGSPKSGQ